MRLLAEIHQLQANLKETLRKSGEKNWYNHFSSRLGEAPNIEDEDDEEVDAVQLDITLHIYEEHHRAEQSLSERMASEEHHRVEQSLSERIASEEHHRAEQSLSERIASEEHHRTE